VRKAFIYVHKRDRKMRRLSEDRMTARERIEAAVNHEEPDRVPIFDLVQHIPLIEHCTGEKATTENGLDLLCRTIGEHLDVTRGISPPAEEQLLEMDDGFVYRQEWWTRWQVRRPFDDVDGALAFIRRNIEEIRGSRETEMWTFAGKANVWGGSSQTPREQFLDLQKKVGDNTVLFPAESPVGLDTAFYRTGLELFSYAYQDDPELISEWLDALNQHEIKRVHATADRFLSPVALVYSDLANKNKTLFSPAFLRKEFFPRLRRLVDAWHEHGIKVIYHSDGNLWEVLDDFVAAGVDGINPLEPLCGMDVCEVKKAYPSLTLMGGIDATALLAYGTMDDVRRAVRRAIDCAAPGGGLILGSSTEIHPACRLENILTMWDTILTYGRYR